MGGAEGGGGVMCEVPCGLLYSLTRCTSPPPPQCQDRTERDRLLVFVDKLMYHKVGVAWGGAGGVVLCEGTVGCL